MKKSIFTLLTLTVVLVLSGCNGIVPVAVQDSDQEIVSNYIDNLLGSEGINSRSAPSGEMIGYELEIPIFDEDGGLIEWEDLSPEEQEYITRQWKNQQAQAILGNIEQVPFLRDYLIAFNRTAELMSPSSRGSETFFDRLSTELQSIEHHQNAAPMTTARGFAANRLSMFRSHYKNGNIVGTLGASSGSSGSGLGHGSIIANGSNSWRPEWTTNSTDDFTMSAWGNGGSHWNGGQNVVDPEPVNYWLGSYPEVPNPHITYLNVHEHYWVWTGFLKGYYAKPNVSSSKRSGAVNYALAQRGKPYNYNLALKTPTNSFYCTSLAWRASYQQGIGICGTPWADIAGIINDENTTIVYHD